MSDETEVPATQPDPPYVDAAVAEEEPARDPETRPSAIDDVKVPSEDRVPSPDE